MHSPKRKIDARTLLLAQQMVHTWSSSVADRILNPIAGIQAALEIIRKQIAFEGFKPDAEGKSEMVLKAIEHSYNNIFLLEDYVRDLMEYSAPLNLSAKTYASDFLINEGLAYLQTGKFKKNTSDLHFKIDNPQINCDLKSFLYAFKALVHNSFEATPLGSKPKVEVCVKKFRWQSKEKYGAVLQITDKGKGFSPEAIESGKNAFWTTKEASSGMGLTNVQKIANAHQGRLKISNPSGGGARVSVYFPKT
ncbi:MAG: ATP-binding protein [Oligoflexales bacterium]